jgi:hypothetical protein
VAIAATPGLYPFSDNLIDNAIALAPAEGHITSIEL